MKTAQQSVTEKSKAANAPVQVRSPAAAPQVAPKIVNSQQRNPKSDDERLKRREQEKARIRAAARLLQRTWRGHATRRNLEAAFIPLQAMMRGYIVRMRALARLANTIQVDHGLKESCASSESGLFVSENEDDTSEESVVGAKLSSEQDTEAKEQFYDDLAVYMEVSGAKIPESLVIGKREIDIWVLFSLVTRQDCHPEDRDWEWIASRLGFDVTKYPAVVKQVRECYQRNLAEFEETIREYDDEEGEDDPDDTAEDLHEDRRGGDVETEDVVLAPNAVLAPEQPLRGHTSPAYQSSPPIAASKRNHRHANPFDSDLSHPSDGPRKRRRLSKDVVIPQTPEDKLELGRQQLPQRAADDEVSPLKGRGANDAKAVDFVLEDEPGDLQDTEMEDREGVAELPRRIEPQTRKHIEPETQDWGRVMEEEHPLRRSIEEDDVSPSQQLEIESDVHNSPQKFVSKRNYTAASSSIQASSGAVSTIPHNGKVLRDQGSRPGHSGAEARSEEASRASVRGFSTKRALPPQYSSKMGDPRAAAPSAASLTRLTNTQPRRPSALPSSTIPARRTPTSSSPSPRDLSEGNSPSAEPIIELDYDGAYVDAQVDHFQALGYEVEHIDKALHAAGLQRGLVAVALQSLKEGRGIPPDEAGIWTQKDDATLRKVMKYDRLMRSVSNAADSPVPESAKVRAWTARSKLVNKHGEAGVKLRTFFLEKLDS